ncbi:MAG: hydrogenase iron-sulfur subunit [Opitutales bacterium]
MNDLTYPRPQEAEPAKPPEGPPALSRNIQHVRDAHPSPPARGEELLRRFDGLFLHLDRSIHRAIPPALNPFTQSGAIANTSFLIAAVTGILLLFWYSPSLYHAYDSIEGIREGSWLGQMMRSLHRYSSDACMLFIFIHAFRIFVSRRIFGARWLAWVTGVGLLGTMWLIGWTGYWLVWDVRAQYVAEGSARFLDVLPIFGQPLASTFLTNETVPSLLFFLVFFAHMLLPLAICIGLWLHLSRLNRAKLLTSRHLTLWIIGTMVALSIVFPATSAERADMTALGADFTMDWWYLWPIWLTERLSGGVLWVVSLVGTIAFVSVPWWMKRSFAPPTPKAVVDVPSCNGCTLCSKDCPFDAISMIPRQDGGRATVQSYVNPDLCIGCGICTGACDSDAINIPWLNVKKEKEQIDAWVNEKLLREERPMLAFVCASSAGAEFAVNPVSGDCPKLPGYRVKAIPCAGWVSPVLLEHCLSGGSEGILIAGCGPGEHGYREGAQWLEQRLAGQRRPILRKHKVDASRVHFVQFDRTRPDDLAKAAEDFRAGRQRVERKRARITGAFAGTALAALLALATAGGSVLPYSSPQANPELVISFRHLAERQGETRQLSEEELERIPVHMRGEMRIDRSRAPVRMRVQVDGDVILEESYAPHGLRSDGPSVVLEYIPLSVGLYQIQVEIGDTADPGEWSHQWSETVEVEPNRRRVLLFEGDRFHLE